MNPLCCIAPVLIDDRTNPVIAKPAPNQQQHSQLGLMPSNHASKPSFSTQASWISQDQLERLSSEDVNLEGKDSSSNGGFFFGNGGVGGGAGAGAGVAGIMYKWTHYGKGWRARWFELEDGVLSYYKIHGPDKIVMNPARDKGVRVIGEESVRYIRKASCGSSNKLGAGAGASSRPCKPFGEVHLKVSSIRASKSDDKRLTIFTGTKTLHLRCVSRENRAAWVEALQVAKDLFPRVPSGDILPCEDAVVSTEKLRERLLQEGIGETVVKDCETIMLSEVSNLQNRLKVLTQKHLILLDTLRQLETEKIELETTVVDETKEHDSCCGQGRRFSDFYSVVSEVSASDSEADNESHDGADVESDEDDVPFFDTNDILSADALRSASYRSREAEGNGSIYDKDSFFSDRLQAPVRIPQYPYVRRRDNLPEPKEKEKPVGLWSIIKENIGKDLSGVCLPVYFNEPLSSLQKCFEDLEYSYLIDRALEWGQEMEHLENGFSGTPLEPSSEHLSQDEMSHILDVLKFVAESSRQHFNHKYRTRVCQKVLETAVSVVNPCEVPLGTLLQFVSAIPREFTDHNGSLRKLMLEWLQGCNRNTSDSLCTDGTRLVASLHEYLKEFVSDHVEGFDDEDLEAWESQTKRWARVFFLTVNDEEHLADIITFVQNSGVSFFQEKNHLERAPAKFLIFILSMLLELQNMQDGVSELSSSVKSKSCIGIVEENGKQIVGSASVINEKFAAVLLSILKQLVSFADSSCSIFWSHTTVENGVLSGSIIGKLGGPSQRRLSVPTTTAVLEAVTSVKIIGLISSYCGQVTSGVTELKLALAFFWKFVQHTLSSQSCNSEAEAEIYLAAFEALAAVLNAFVSLCSARAFNLLENDNTLLDMVNGEYWLQASVPAFLHNINHLLTAGLLARSRRAVLLSWKWLCVESLLSVMNVLDVRRTPGDRTSFFSDDTVKSIFYDIVESLENAGEGSALPMLKSVRLALGILASGKSSLDGFSGVDTQTMWQLVKSCWILHISCKKRRVAPIAALLSSVLHSSLFSNKDMHVAEDGDGPLKWFVEKVLEEGQKSPRTIRLAALHLTGLWLMYPRTIKYYIKELKLLTLYGSVAFDEDFEAELCDNNDARTEVSLLAKNPDPELTEVFINTELYARVSVAGLFQKLADLANMAEPACQNQDYQDAIVAGKLFLLELLDAAVHDKDLAKELYKKYSAIHRRKIRAWQMICIMSRFVSNDIVGQVMDSVHICLYRNNLPAVRQYLETFAINIYLKFPPLVKEQLVPVLQNYDTKAQQALSSYVFIAANVILHAEKMAQQTNLRELLPPIIPLLTSHHHSLRGFTQLLVHRVLFRLFPPLESTSSQTIPLEKLSFENLKSYLDKNPDCSRLRSSMEGYLDAYDPTTSATPAGVFVNRVEESEFECVPTCLMDNVISFLNDVREDLRASMAKDIVTIKNEGFKIEEEPNRRLMTSTSDEESLSEPSSLDFQKKITLSKHEKQDATSTTSVLQNGETYKRLFEMEKEDELVSQLLRSRSMEVERLKSGRQSLILVASLVDRIPNLAGLARTCEIFKASGLVVGDASIIHDKQFQLISVTAEKWVPIVEVPVNSLKLFLEKKKREGFSILGLEQTANSVSLDKYQFPKKTVLVLGREKEGIPVDIIHVLDACVEIPQLGVVRSLNVHVSGAIALWEYTRQQRIQ